MMSPPPWCIPRWLMSSLGASECPRVNGAGDPACERWPGDIRRGCGHGVTGHVAGRGVLVGGWRGMPTPRGARPLPASKPLQEGRPLWPFLGPRAAASRCH